MSNHLKPCPFCGGDASFNDHTDGCYFTVLRKLKADPPADLSRVPDLIEAWNTRTAIQQAEARTDDPVAYVCPTSHHARDGSMEDGPDYLEWADEASDYEKRVGTPLYTHPAPGVPEFSLIAKRKLDELQEQGFAITGYAIQRGTKRGFITDGGFVGWWRSDEAPSVFLVRDVASLLRASVPDVCNALAELGYEPRRSTNAAISPDEAIAVAKRLNLAPGVPDDVVRDAERYRFIRDADVSDDLIPDIALYAMESLDEYIDAAMLADK